MKMNYINYQPQPTSGHQVAPTQMNASITPVPVPQVRSQSQTAFVLSPPSQPTVNHPSANQRNSYPMLMQMGSTNPPVFYTYQNTNESLVNPALHNKSNDSSSSNSAIAPMVLSQMSPVQSGLNIMKTNGNSPTLGPTHVNITSENKPSAARSLGNMFNIPTIPNLGTQPSVVQGNPMCQNPNQSNQPTSEITSFLSSLQAAGVHLVESGCGNNNKNTPVPVPVIESDKRPVEQFITSLQASGINVVENNSDKTLAISLPNRCVDEKHICEG